MSASPSDGLAEILRQLVALSTSSPREEETVQAEGKGEGDRDGDGEEPDTRSES